MSIPNLDPRRIPFPKPATRERSGTPRVRIAPHVRAALWRRDGGRCAACGRACGAGEWEAHRAVPGAAGGAYRLRNLVTLCRPCHERTFAGAPRDPEAARARAKVERLRRRKFGSG